MGDAERIVVISDIQAPLNDQAACDAVTDFLADYQPDKLALVGDEADMTELGKWVRGQKTEFAGNLQAGIDATHAIMSGFREAVGDIPIVVQRSNHTTTRVQNYIDKCAPALATLRSLNYSTLMGYDGLDIKVSMSPTPIAPGWHMIHGDEANMTITAGGSALSAARKLGTSIVCGHTHKQGLQHDHDAHSGKVHTYRFGMEVGHLMSMEKADINAGGYLKYGGSNWQAGFGILTVFNGVTMPSLVPIVNNRFTVDGQIYWW
jgi:predicted phosphodiesterase